MTASESLLDRAVERARAGMVTMQTVLWTLAAGSVFVPSGADPGEDRSGIQPVYLPKGETQMLAVFSTADGAGSLVGVAPFVVVFTGADLIRSMPARFGLVANPGSSLGFDVEPDGVAAFRQEIST